MKIIKVDENNFKTIIKQDINNYPVDNQSDKYLFDRKKTIGFRKDKKLHKFVGLRDGYSKQLEFTIKSVIIDGIEKIASNRVNFSDISVSGEQDQFMSVFIPSTPTPFTGFVVIVNKRDIYPTEINIEEAIKFLVSGGIAVPNSMLPKELKNSQVL